MAGALWVFQPGLAGFRTDGVRLSGISEGTSLGGLTVGDDC